jgi:hypothetical protein
MPHHHLMNLKVVIVIKKVMYFNHIIDLKKKNYPKKPISHHTNYNCKTITSHDISIAFATTQLFL